MWMSIGKSLNKDNAIIVNDCQVMQCDCCRVVGRLQCVVTLERDGNWAIECNGVMMVVDGA